MVSFLNILATPQMGLSPLIAESVAVDGAARNQLDVFRTGIDCSSVAAPIIHLEQALAAGKDAGRLMDGVVSGLIDLSSHHPREYEEAVRRAKEFAVEHRGDPRAVQQFGDPLDVFTKISEGGTPIRFRNIKSEGNERGVAIEEKLLFVPGGRLSPLTLVSPDGSELFRFYPPYVEAGALLFVGKQEHREPIQIASALLAGIPLAMTITLKGANGKGPHFVVTSRGKERPQIDRADGLPNVGEGEQHWTPGDRLHIGDKYKLRLEPVEELRAEPTRLAVAAMEEERPNGAPVEVVNGVALARIALRIATPAPSAAGVAATAPLPTDSPARQAIGFLFGRLRPFELKPGEEIILGRWPDRKGKYGIIPDLSAYVSREHVKIHRDLGGGFWIEDLESSNGTAVNDAWLQPHQKVRLRAGDRVKLGRQGETFIFDYWMPEEPRRTTSTPPAASLQPAPSVAAPLPLTPPREMTPVPLPTMPTTWLWFNLAVAPGDSNPLIFSSWLGKWWKRLRRRLPF